MCLCATCSLLHAGGLSDATTIPATDQEAKENALRGLALSPPVTPADRIRRTSSVVLPGNVGDRRILGNGKCPSSASSRTKQSAKTKKNKQGKQSTKGKCKVIKKHGKSAKKQTGRRQNKKKTPKAPTRKQHAPTDQTALTLPSVPPQVPPQAEGKTEAASARAPAPKATAPKATAAKQAPKPSSKQQSGPLVLVKREKQEPFPSPQAETLPGLPHTTPTSTRHARAVDTTQEETLRRCSTSQQLAHTAASPSDNQQAPSPAPSQANAAQTPPQETPAPEANAALTPPQQTPPQQTPAPAPNQANAAATPPQQTPPQQTPAPAPNQANAAVTPPQQTPPQQTPAPAPNQANAAVTPPQQTPAQQPHVQTAPPGMGTSVVATAHAEPAAGNQDQTGGRRRNERTVEQKALHARYMRFSRSIRST